LTASPSTRAPTVAARAAIAVGQRKRWAKDGRGVLVGRHPRSVSDGSDGCDRGELPFPQVTSASSLADAQRRRRAAQKT
jgi:hypothetical protein